MSFFTAEGITKSFYGNKAVDNVSLKVEKGEIVGLIGANGAGKTTLFNCLSGYYRPDEGRITFKGASIEKMKSHNICKLGIARTFQIAKPFGELTVLENVMIGSYSKRKKKQDAMEFAIKCIDFSGLAGKERVAARDLNTGDQRRLELARALATDPELLLLDEVMAGLTPSESVVMTGLISKTRDSGITVLMIEHIMTALMTLSDRVYALDRGSVIAEGTPKEVASNQYVVTTYLGKKGALKDA